MRYHRIPDETIRRLPIYLRGLLVSAEQGKQSISSRDLADFVGVNSWQIRKDFSYFGDFGTRGVGY
ncbi:MAG: winged-helix domain-containing protein, partial [Planctomycetota bacterium]